MNYQRPELQDRLASEYVLGTLHGRARKRFQRLLQQDAKLRDAVAFWEQELVPMASVLSVPAPKAQVWEAIAERVAPRSESRARGGFFERLFTLATLGPLAAGLFVGVAVMLVAPMMRETPPGQVAEGHVPQSYAGFLQDGNGKVTALVNSLRYGTIVDIKLLHPVSIAADRMLYLWALPSGKPPLLLGTIPSQGKGTLTLPATSEALLSQVTELAVSSEPTSSTPPAQPSQPFVLRGPCAKFW